MKVVWQQWPKVTADATLTESILCRHCSAVVGWRHHNRLGGIDDQGVTIQLDSRGRPQIVCPGCAGMTRISRQLLPTTTPATYPSSNPARIYRRHIGFDEA